MGTSMNRPVLAATSSRLRHPVDFLNIVRYPSFVHNRLQVERVLLTARRINNIYFVKTFKGVHLSDLQAI